jgi:predicted Kef-type K+ transport protein
VPSYITTEPLTVFVGVQALSKFAFGLGGLQMLLCTVAFAAFALPVGEGLGTRLLTDLFNAPLSLVSIRSFDEAIVIAAALSLSSSAFVLSILKEKGELSTKIGAATLGILLFQVFELDGPPTKQCVWQCLVGLSITSGMVCHFHSPICCTLQLTTHCHDGTGYERTCCCKIGDRATQHSNTNIRCQATLLTHYCVMQDIAVVPLLVLLPLLESSGDMNVSNVMELVQVFGPAVLTTLGWVGLLIVGGRTVLRRVFEVRTEGIQDWALHVLQLGYSMPKHVACEKTACFCTSHLLPASELK